ncbi:MAG: NAD-dependent epimerase/dehydratase family protein [Chthoniobacterales bacterium]
MRKIFIAGCGFLGETAAFLFLDAGWRVSGICGSESSAARFFGTPLDIRLADLGNSDSLHDLAASLPPVDVVLHCASSRGGGEEAYRRVYLEGMRNLVSVFPAAKHYFISSTSVYAQTDGSVVEENSETNPQRETGRILLAAEKTCLAAGGSVLRLGGLYDFTRWVLLKKFLSGEATIDSGRERWLNQIHREDAARAVLHLAALNAPAGIYNVCDNTPVTQREVYEFFSEYFQKPLPPEAEPDLQRKRGWTNKRISNAKLRATGWEPQFPSFRETLNKSL